MKIIKEIVKNKTETLIVSLDEFKGKDYANVRVFFKNDDGELCPTKKGVTLTLDTIPQVIEGLLTIAEMLEKKEKKETNSRKKDKNIVVDEDE